MVNKIAAVRKKVTRGTILMMLYSSASTPMLVSTLEQAILPENPQITQDIVAQVNYLADRGYIKHINPDDLPIINPMRGALVKLTPKGTDLVEDTIDNDPGIIFGDASRI